MPQIVDQYGRPIDVGAIREPQTAQVRHLRSEHDEHPARGLTPARIHGIMREAEQGNIVRQLELADDMEERDAHIFSELSKRKTALIKLDWNLLPPEGADAAETKLTEQVEEWLRAIPNFKRNILFNMMDGVLKGFSMIEQWWELDDGFLQPRHEFRPQRWFCLDEDRDNLNLRSMGGSYGEPLRPYNWIAHMHPARSGYIARQSLCRVLMFPYLYKNYSTRDLAEFLEIYGLPLRLGKYPTGATDKEKASLLRAVTEIGHNAAGIIPLGMELTFEDTASGTQVPFEAMLDRMDAAESKAIVGQTLTSSEGQHGTQALGNIHNDVRLDILGADAELVSATVTAQLVAPLALLNIAGANPKRLPRFSIEVPEPEDISLMAEALPKLAGAGVQIGVNWVSEKLRIPKPEADEAVLKGPPDPAAPGAAGGSSPGAPGTVVPPNAKPGNNPATKTAPADKAAANRAALATLIAALAAQDAGAAGQPPARDALDDLVDQAAADWRPVMTPIVQPILDELAGAVARGETLQEFSAKLPGLVARMDARAFANQAARASFIARLAGLADLDLAGNEAP